MNKYKGHFLKNVRKKLEQWEDVGVVSYTELYRFLHSIAGTAAVIGLDEIGMEARQLMNDLDEPHKQQWTVEEVKQYIFKIVKLCYENEGFVSPTSVLKGKGQGEQPVILLVGNDTTFLMHMKEKLGTMGWYVIAVAQAEKVVSFFYDMRPHCIVIHFSTKEKHGFELLEMLNEKLKQQFISTMIISDDNKKETRLKSYALGAGDFLAKPFDMDELIVRIQRQLERKKLIDELLLLDELTHVYNRKYLKQVYEQLQSDITRFKESYCLAVLDLDYFKKVNDHYGHLAGDTVLKEFARFLRQETRAGDTVVRFGGEEFLLLFPKTNIDTACLIIERIRTKFSNVLFQQGEKTFSCTFSSGIVEISEGNRPLEYWLQLADHALYAAKQAGRNRVQVAKPSKEEPYQKLIKIAIVDDDAIMRTIITDILEKSPCEINVKYDVRSFKDGVSFIESTWHQDTLPCLVILDGVLPKMDGIEVLQWLRAQKGAERYKVIMLTSRQSEKDIARALELGADDYITKPFKLLELEERICQMMKRMS